MAKKAKQVKELSPPVFLVSKGQQTAVVLCEDLSERRVPLSEGIRYPKITKEELASLRDKKVAVGIENLRVAFGDFVFSLEGSS